MPGNKTKARVETWPAFAAQLLESGHVAPIAAVIGWLLLAVLLYFWVRGEVGLIGVAQESYNRGSPYVHWGNIETEISLADCERLTREVYEITGTPVTEIPDTDTTSVAQVGVIGDVTSVIVCVHTRDRTTVFLTAAGPEQTATKNRAAQLRTAFHAKLGS